MKNINEVKEYPGLQRIINSIGNVGFLGYLESNSLWAEACYAGQKLTI